MGSPEIDAARPRAVIGGHVVATLVGLVLVKTLGPSHWVAALAVGAAIAAMQLVGTSLKASQNYLDAEYRQPCFLLIGNEQQGLPADYENECDLLVKIPMAGRADSLNAAMAAAVMAFAVKASWR